MIIRALCFPFSEIEGGPLVLSPFNPAPVSTPWLGGDPDLCSDLIPRPLEVPSHAELGCPFQWPWHRLPLKHAHPGRPTPCFLEGLWELIWTHLRLAELLRGLVSLDPLDSDFPPPENSRLPAWTRRAQAGAHGHPLSAPQRLSPRSCQGGGQGETHCGLML